MQKYRLIGRAFISVGFHDTMIFRLGEHLKNRISWGVWGMWGRGYVCRDENLINNKKCFLAVVIGAWLNLLKYLWIHINEHSIKYSLHMCEIESKNISSWTFGCEQLKWMKCRHGCRLCPPPAGLDASLGNFIRLADKRQFLCKIRCWVLNLLKI